jgi:hypothetical protein
MAKLQGLHKEAAKHTRRCLALAAKRRARNFYFRSMFNDMVSIFPFLNLKRFQVCFVSNRLFLHGTLEHDCLWWKWHRQTVQVRSPCQNWDPGVKSDSTYILRKIWNRKSKLGLYKWGLPLTSGISMRWRFLWFFKYSKLAIGVKITCISHRPGTMSWRRTQRTLGSTGHPCWRTRSSSSPKICKTLALSRLATVARMRCTLTVFQRIW